MSVKIIVVKDSILLVSLAINVSAKCIDSSKEIWDRLVIIQ